MKSNWFLKAIVLMLWLLLFTTLQAEYNILKGAEQDPDLVWQKDEGTGLISFSPDGKWLLTSGVNAGDVAIRNISNGEILKTFPSSSTFITGTFSPDGNLIATGNEHGLVQIWDIASQTVLHTFNDAPLDNGNAGTISLEFSPDGKQLALGSRVNFSSVSNEGKNNLFVWDIETGKLLWKKLDGEYGEIKLQYIYGTPYLYVNNHEHNKGSIYYAESGKFIRSVTTTPTYQRKYSSDGEYYITTEGSDQKYTIRVCLTINDSTLQTLFYPSTAPDIVFTPKNGFFVIAGKFNTDDNYTTSFWDITSGKRLFKHSMFGRPAISIDSQYIAFSSYNNTQLRRIKWTTTLVEEQQHDIYNVIAKPNPATDQIKITFTLPSPEKIYCSVVSLTGETVTVLAENTLSEGEQYLLWRSSDVAQGTYLIQLTIAERVITIPVTIQRGE